jgi:hypothetical protein
MPAEASISLLCFCLQYCHENNNNTKPCKDSSLAQEKDEGHMKQNQIMIAKPSLDQSIHIQLQSRENKWLF